jgi:hypothetical protein
MLLQGSGTCSATGGSGGWYCQHRIPAISGMVGFRNAVGSAAMTNWTSPQPNQIAFGRGFILYYYCMYIAGHTDKMFILQGNIGYVAINNNDSVWNAVFSTSLPDGQYCDVISGAGSSGSCSGTRCVIFFGWQLLILFFFDVRA